MHGRNKTLPVPDGPCCLPVRDGRLLWIPHVRWPLADAELLARLISETAWQSETIRLWGRTYMQPRLIAWHGDPGSRYRYSGKTHHPLPWTPLLLSLKTEVERQAAQHFNSVLLNYYRDEHDSMGMHSDDERELGANPIIASLSLGARRPFLLKHNTAGESLRLPLGEGDLLIMAGTLQHYWKHGIARQARPCGPRINLTFRHILSPA
jgi:alkylated DNA repair dioxygenase AlkB